MGNVEITDNERLMLSRICDSEYQHVPPDDEGVIDYPVWSFSVTGEFGRSAGGVMGSLVKKGLVGTDQGCGEDSTCWITAQGFEALK